MNIRMPDTSKWNGRKWAVNLSVVFVAMFLLTNGIIGATYDPDYSDSFDLTRGREDPSFFERIGAFWEDVGLLAWVAGDDPYVYQGKVFDQPFGINAQWQTLASDIGTYTDPTFEFVWNVYRYNDGYTGNAEHKELVGTTTYQAKIPAGKRIWWGGRAINKMYIDEYMSRSSYYNDIYGVNYADVFCWDDPLAEQTYNHSNAVIQMWNTSLSDKFHYDWHMFLAPIVVDFVMADGELGMYYKLDGYLRTNRDGRTQVFGSDATESLYMRDWLRNNGSYAVIDANPEHDYRATIWVEVLVYNKSYSQTQPIAHRSALIASSYALPPTTTTTAPPTTTTAPTSTTCPYTSTLAPTETTTPPTTTALPTTAPPTPVAGEGMLTINSFTAPAQAKYNTGVTLTVDVKNIGDEDECYVRFYKINEGVYELMTTKDIIVGADEAKTVTYEFLMPDTAINIVAEAGHMADGVRVSDFTSQVLVEVTFGDVEPEKTTADYMLVAGIFVVMGAILLYAYRERLFKKKRK